MKKLCPRELNTPVANTERDGKGTQDFWIPQHWAAPMGHYGWNTSGSLEFLFYSTVLYQCHGLKDAKRNPSWGATPPPALPGSWPCERQTKSSGRACFGRERGIEYSSTNTPGHLPRAQLLVIRILQAQNTSSPQKRLYRARSKSCFVLLFHIQIREQGTQAWLFPGDT